MQQNAAAQLLAQNQALQQQLLQANQALQQIHLTKSSPEAQNSRSIVNVNKLHVSKQSDTTVVSQNSIESINGNDGKYENTLSKQTSRTPIWSNLKSDKRPMLKGYVDCHRPKLRQLQKENFFTEKLNPKPVYISPIEGNRLEITNLHRKTTKEDLMSCLCQTGPVKLINYHQKEGVAEVTIWVGCWTMFLVSF